MRYNAVKMMAKDNVAVVISPVATGAEVRVRDEKSLMAGQDVPAGHKVALKAIRSGRNVIRYGEVILRATEDIRRGEWVHVHNTDSAVY